MSMFELIYKWLNRPKKELLSRPDGKFAVKFKGKFIDDDHFQWTKAKNIEKYCWMSEGKARELYNRVGTEFVVESS